MVCVTHFPSLRGPFCSLNGQAQVGPDVISKVVAATAIHVTHVSYFTGLHHTLRHSFPSVERALPQLVRVGTYEWDLYVISKLVADKGGADCVTAMGGWKAIAIAWKPELKTVNNIAKVCCMI